MSHRCSDPTAEKAIGAVDREIKAVQEVAKALTVLRGQGLLTRRQVMLVAGAYRGLHRHLLLELLG